MNLGQPMASRPLVMLTLTVLAVHLLLLRGTTLREPSRPPGMRSLVTRVLDPGASQAVAQPPGRVDQKSAPARLPPTESRRRRPAPAKVETAPLEPSAASPPPSEIEAAAPHLTVLEPSAAPAPPPSTPASAPLPLVDTAAAAAASAGSAAAAAPASGDAPAIAFAIPGSVRLRYAVNGQSRGRGWTVNGQLQWQHDGSQYEAMLEYSAPLLPSRSQRSAGRITAAGLAPLRFSDRSRSEQATHFDRAAGQLVFSNNAPQQPLLPGMQDRLSVFMQLASMLAAAPEKFPAGSEIVLQTAGTRDVQSWQFKVLSDETLQLPGGSVPTRKLVREPRGEYDTRVELWLATGMDYVPVRIRLTQANGDYVDQQWSSTDRP
jgi:hypothetical protein